MNPLRSLLRLSPWLLRPLLEQRGLYAQVIIAAAVTNIFSFAVSLFSMTVYDRVIPNNATSSLIGLAIGIGIIVVADFVLRVLRAYFIDVAGAAVDLKVGESIFQKLITMRLDATRRSTGSFAGVLREFETLRDFFGSTTAIAFVDVPFISFFLFVIWLIGGWLVLVPLAAIPIVLLAGFLTRPALSRMSASMMTEGLSKQGVLVETVGSLETVKAARAGPMLAKRWRSAATSQAKSGLRQRLVGTLTLTVASSMQNLAYAATVIVGAHLIATHDLTTGALVACSILSTRCVAPLTQVAQMLSRVTATREAYLQIDKLMTSAEEGSSSQVRRARIEPSVEFREVVFRYGVGTTPALNNVSFRIRPGERVALLGRIGSGKSTILRLILGLREPQSGIVMVGGSDVRQLHPEDLRGAIGATLQEGVLFSGSVQDNILLGRTDLDAEEMLRVAELSGTNEFMAQLANGYALTLSDRGEGLSGGQRQSIALARALAGRPPMLLLDEPTSAIDPNNEAALIGRLEAELEGRTVLIVTHRPPLLKLVQRIILMDGGKIVADGPRDEVLRRMGVIKPAPPAAVTQ